MTEYSHYTDLKIGSSVANMTPVTELLHEGTPAFCPPPATKFKPATEFVTMANGTAKALGKPIITWEFRQGVPQAARCALRAFLDGFSGRVYICSPDADGNIATWSAIMHWPTLPLGYQAFDHTTPFTLEFTRCEKVT